MGRCSQFLFAFAIFASVQGSAKQFIYIVNNTPAPPPEDGSVIVIDEDTLTEIAGSPFTTFNGGAGDQLQIAIRPAMNGAAARAYVTGFLGGDKITVFDINSSTGALTQIAGSPFSNANNVLYPFQQPFGVIVHPTDGSIYISNFATSGAPGPGFQTIYKLDKDLNYIASIVTPYYNLSGMVFDQNGNFLFVTATGDSRVMRIDANLTAVLDDVPTGGVNPYGIAIHPNDTYVYATNLSGVVSHFDYPTLINPVSVGGLMNPIGIKVDPDGSRVYVANAGGTTISVLDSTTLASITSFSSQGMQPYVVALDPAGTRLYATNAASGDFSIHDNIHDTFPAIIGSPVSGFGTIYGIAFSPQLVSTVTNLTGIQKKNNYGVIYELYNLLRWEAPSGAEVAGYNIYRNEVLIATLGADALQYEDHNRPKGVTTTYSVTTLDASGNESDPVDVDVN